MKNKNKNNGGERMIPGDEWSSYCIIARQYIGIRSEEGWKKRPEAPQRQERLVD